MDTNTEYLTNNISRRLHGSAALLIHIFLVGFFLLPVGCKSGAAETGTDIPPTIGWFFSGGTAPTQSATPTASKTPAVPSPTQSPISTATMTPLPIFTIETTATKLSTSTPKPDTPTPTQTPVCVLSPPSSWVAYTVQQGDFLFNLAVQTGTTVETVTEINCLDGPTLSIGMTLWLPNLPVTPTYTPTLPLATDVPPAQPPRPTNPTATKTPPSLPLSS